MNNLINIDGLLRVNPSKRYDEWDDNIVVPFKSRTIDIDKPIHVYRNLNRKGRVYSIRQGGLVVAHATAVMLMDVDFIINKSGKERVMKTKQRNVHAYMCGRYVTFGGSSTAKNKKFGFKINYNPFDDNGFYIEETKQTVHHAYCVIANSEGVGGIYLQPIIF